MVAKKGDNDIELEDESPRLEGSHLATGEGRTTVTSSLLAARMTLVC